MLKVDRTNRTLGPIAGSNLADARLLERADLQECIYNSSKEFFAEIGEHVFVIGQEIRPSQTVQDRVDLLGVDIEGTSVIVELKRGSDKLQMLQAISYAGMISRWTPQEFRDLLSEESWEQLEDSLVVDIEELNRRQRILLVAEKYDYALLAGAEWLSEHHGVDIRCASVSLAVDAGTGAEYLICTSIFPPPALAEQAAAREGSRRGSRPTKWSDWDEAISRIENESVRAFAREELMAGRENNLPKRSLYYRHAGKRRWTLSCRNEHGYVWQRGRFLDDVAFWQARLSEPASVTPVKGGIALSFRVLTNEDLHAFREVAMGGLVPGEWSGLTADQTQTEDDDGLE